MKKICLLTIFAGITVLLAGCRTAPEKIITPDAMPSDGSAAAFKIAESNARTMFNALQSGDFKYWRDASPENTAAPDSGKKFAALCAAFEKFGKLENFTCLGEINRGSVKGFIWKFSFRKPGKTASDKPVPADLLYRVQIVWLDGKPAVAGCGFLAW